MAKESSSDHPEISSIIESVANVAIQDSKESDEPKNLKLNETKLNSNKDHEENTREEWADTKCTNVNNNVIFSA